MSKKALVEAVKKAKSQAKLAWKVNNAIDEMIQEGIYNNENPPQKISQQNIWRWLNGHKGPVPPAEYVLAIEAAVQIPKEVQREDLYRKTSNAL